MCHMQERCLITASVLHLGSCFSRLIRPLFLSVVKLYSMVWMDHIPTHWWRGLRPLLLCCCEHHVLCLGGHQCLPPGQPCPARHAAFLFAGSWQQDSVHTVLCHCFSNQFRGNRRDVLLHCPLDLHDHLHCCAFLSMWAHVTL